MNFSLQLEAKLEVKNCGKFTNLGLRLVSSFTSSAVTLVLLACWAKASKSSADLRVLSEARWLREATTSGENFTPNSDSNSEQRSNTVNSTAAFSF